MRVRVAFLLLLALALAGPATGQVSTSTDQASREISREIEARYPVIDDPTINERVGAIVDRLGPVVGGDGFSWQFRVIANQTPNAFALPNGYIYVHEGLLDGLPGDGPLTDDELAFVLAHEMMHVVLNHGSRESSVSTSLQRLINRSGVVRSQATQLVAKLLRGSVEASYSRELETEADREALICMAQAGYKPEAALTLFDRMQQYQQANNVTIRLFHTHPKATDRSANVRGWLDKRATTGAGKSAPRLPVTLVAVVDAGTAAALADPPPTAPEATVAQGTDAGAAQGTDACLENPNAALASDPPPRESAAPKTATLTRPGPGQSPLLQAMGPAASGLSAQRVVKALAPQLDCTMLVALPAASHPLDRAALRQTATERGADAVLLIAIDKMIQQAMPWPDGVVFSVDVTLTATLLRVRENATAERFTLHAGQQAILSAHGARTRDDVRYEAVEQAMKALKGPLGQALRPHAKPSPATPP